MIKIDDVGVTKNGYSILRSISAEINSGEVVAIMGSNGAGKSTLLKVLAGVSRNFAGSIQINGRSIRYYNPVELARVRGVLSQQIVLEFPMKAIEVVMLGRFPYRNTMSREGNLQIGRDCLDQVGMSSFTDRSITTLSGGEKQRVHLARVLAQLRDNSDKCKFLLLDEPLASLDIGQQYKLLKQLRLLVQRRNVGVVIIVHDLHLARLFCDKILLLHKGGMVTYGAPEEVLSINNIRNCFDVHDMEFLHANDPSSIL